jgi:hypothetical protein
VASRRCSSWARCRGTRRKHSARPPKGGGAKRSRRRRRPRDEKRLPHGEIRAVRRAPNRPELSRLGSRARAKRQVPLFTARLFHGHRGLDGPRRAARRGAGPTNPQPNTTASLRTGLRRHTAEPSSAPKGMPFFVRVHTMRASAAARRGRTLQRAARRALPGRKGIDISRPHSGSLTGQPDADCRRLRRARQCTGPRAWRPPRRTRRRSSSRRRRATWLPENLDGLSFRDLGDHRLMDRSGTSSACTSALCIRRSRRPICPPPAGRSRPPRTNLPRPSTPPSSGRYAEARRGAHGSAGTTSTRMLTLTRARGNGQERAWPCKPRADLSGTRAPTPCTRRPPHAPFSEP